MSKWEQPISNNKRKTVFAINGGGLHLQNRCNFSHNGNSLV